MSLLSWVLSPKRIIGGLACMGSLYAVVNHSALTPYIFPGQQTAPVAQVQMAQPNTAGLQGVQPVPAGVPQAQPAPVRVDTQALNLADPLKEKGAWQRDWWKYLIILLVVTLALFILTKVFRSVLRFLGLVLCLGIGAGGAFLFGPKLEPVLAEHVSWLNTEHVTTLHWAYVFVFLLSYIVALIVLYILKKPIDMTSSKLESNQDGSDEKKK